MSKPDDSIDANRYRWLRENIRDLINDGLDEAAFSCQIPITRRSFSDGELLDMISDAYILLDEAQKPS